MSLEGCYPFVRGGVSAWIHQYLTCSPEIEFILWTIHASREDTRVPLYLFPENVKEHHMVFLDETVGSQGSRSISSEIAAFRNDAKGCSKIV